MVSLLVLAFVASRAVQVSDAKAEITEEAREEAELMRALPFSV